MAVKKKKKKVVAGGAVKKAAPKKKEGDLTGANIPITQEVELIDTTDLELWNENPRENDAAAEQLAELIKEYGFVTPITIDQNNVVRKGNTGVKAARLLNMPRIPAVRVPWSEGKLITYGIADNKSSEFASWDEEILASLMEKKEVLTNSGDREQLSRVTGFSEDELRGIHFEPDLDKISNVVGASSTITATIKVKCKAEDRDEIKELLKEWATNSGFEEVEVV